MMYLKNILSFLLLLLFVEVASAQQYPVQLNAFLIPPYDMRLSDYAVTSETKLQLQMMMTDLTEPTHQVRLSFALESGTSYTQICTTTSYVTGLSNIMLMPGQMVQLTNIDVRPLFELQNLSGISQATYAGVLPQGLYRFRFQAFDAYTNQALSAPAYAPVYLWKYKPPYLNLPQKGEVILSQNTQQQIFFQWMPRDIAPNTHYVFTLKELWDTSVSAETGFLTSSTLHSEETYSNSLYYGADKPALLVGHRYAWQVRAISANPALPGSSDPTDDNGVYDNAGKSEVFYFDYVEDCYAPSMLTAQNAGKGKVQLEWILSQGTSSVYKVQYRKAGSTSWKSKESYETNYLLTGLKDQTQYEYRIGAVCGCTTTSYSSDTETSFTYSDIYTFTTDASENAANANYQCGMESTVEIENQNLLQGNLSPNETFTAGDFPVTIITANGSDGTYSGTGYIVVPYLADTKIKVKFRGIQINTDRQLISGKVETTYDATESSYLYAEEGTGETGGNNGESSKTVTYPIDTVTVDATSTPHRITITGKDGETETIPMTADYQITDSNGDIWTVDEHGNVSKEKQAKGGESTSKNTDGVNSSDEIESYTAKGISVSWDFSGSTYAVDDPAKIKDVAPKMIAKYQSVKDNEGNTVYPVYKAVVNGKTDQITATITDTEHNLDNASVVFKSLDGRAIDNAQSGNTYTLTLKGLFDYADEDIVAALVPNDSTKNQQIIGSFKLVHLTPFSFKLYLVPTDETSKEKLEVLAENAKDIYSKVGVTLDITTQSEIFNIDTWASGDEIPTNAHSSGSTYSDEQKQINEAFAENYSITDGYVMFVTSKTASSGESGYMKLGGQFGYVFDAGSSSTKSLAHELGHGLFDLEHPFTKYSFAEKATDLLMDYSDGTCISQLDWDYMDDPSLKTVWNTVWQSKSSGEISKTETKTICINSDVSNAIKSKKYVLGANDKYFELPEEAVITSLIYQDNSENPAPAGSINGFLLNNNDYHVFYYTDGGTFAGYKIKSADDDYFKNYYSSKQSESANIEIDKLNCSITVDGTKFDLTDKYCNCANISYNDLTETGKSIYDENNSKVTDKDLLLELAKAGENLTADIYNSFVYIQKNDGNLFLLGTNQSSEYSRERFQNTLSLFEEYVNAVDSLSDYKFATYNELVKFTRRHFQVTKGSDNPLVFPSDMKCVQIISSPFKYLTLARKKELIDLLYKSDYSVLQNIGKDIDAGTILTAIFKESNTDAISTADKKALIDYIAEQNYLKHFVEDLYGYQYEAFLNALLNITLKSYDYSSFKINDPAGDNINTLKFSTKYLALQSESITDKGKVKLQIKHWFSSNETPIEVVPYDPICIEFATDVDFGTSLQFKKGERKVMPAIMAYQLFWDDTKAARWKTAQITLDVGLTVIGIGEIGIAVDAYRAGRTAYATYVALKSLSDVGVGMTDIYIQNSDALTEEQLAKWNKFVLLYSAGSFSASTIDALGSRVIKSSDDFVKFEDDLEKNNIDVDEVLENSDEKDEIENLIDYAGADDLLGVILPRYPANNFLDYVNNSFTTQQKEYFETAKSFYLKNVDNFEINHLRGIDFSQEVKVVNQSANTKMYMVARLDDNENIIYGSYYFDNIDEDVTKLGIGNMNKIITDDKILIEVTINKKTNFLKSRTVNIEDWNDTGEVFEGGATQFFNNKAKNNIDKTLTKIIKRYGQ